MKKIRLTIEWPGACAEDVWARELSKAIEQHDASGITKVTNIELITDFGDTPPLSLAVPTPRERNYPSPRWWHRWR